MWPGFVDALATLLVVMIFALMIFFVAQMHLSSALQGSERGLASLQKKIQEISNLLQIEQQKTSTLSSVAAQANHQTLTAEQELERLRDQVELLNAKLHSLQGVLHTAENLSEERQVIIEDLDKKLTLALVKKVEDMEKYRSEFLGKLKDLLADRSDVRVVGDRFVFQSEVLFPSASATLERQGEKQLQKLALSLKEIADKMPPDIKWVLRVDGHTDKNPIHSYKFDSNWELSAARAISVVKFLIKEGISPDHLAVAGFGEFHPLQEGDDLAHNRRIEFKLDQR